MKILSTNNLLLGCGLLLTASCQAPKQTAADPMQEAMDRIVQSIQPTQFADFVIEVNAPEDEEDALLVLQEAIDSCAARGGGRVVAHGGCYDLNGTLHLCNGCPRRGCRARRRNGCRPFPRRHTWR